MFVWTAVAFELIHSKNQTFLHRAWKRKRKRLRMRRTWKTPERSRPTLGVNGARARSPPLPSPSAILCPRLWATSDLAVRPPSVWTPSRWSGTTQVTWGARPLTKKTRRARTTAPCQVTAAVPGPSRLTCVAVFLAP